MADDGEHKLVPLKPSTRPRVTSEGASPSPPAIVPPHQLADGQLDPTLRLETILGMCRRAYEEYQEACVVADTFGAGMMPDGTDANDLLDALNRVRGEVRRTYQRWFELTAQARKAEDEVRKRKLERPLDGPWLSSYEKLRTSLREEYKGLGPHYELLCDNCAAISIKLRQMEASGRDYDSGEYTELHKLYLSYINQLQKYTEAIKSESINRQTQDVAEKLIQIFERHFGAGYPVEWNQAVLEIRQKIEGAA
jgi:hypothetical protein